MQVEELLSFEEIRQYDVPIRARHYRNVFLLGLTLWAVGQFSLSLSDVLAHGPLALIAAALLSLLGGSLFGLATFAAAYIDHHNQLDRLQRILAYDPQLVPAPPGNASHRLPCGLVIDRNRVVPGSLYVVPTGLLFRSNVFPRSIGQKLFGRPQQPPVELLFGPARELTLHTSLRRQRWLQRLAGSIETPLIVLRLKDSLVPFRVACTFEAQHRLEAALETVRHGTAAG